jgi:transposase
MLKVGHLVDIKALHLQGHSIRAIVEMTGLARNTIRKVLRGQHTLKRRSAPRPGKLDPFKDYLRQRVAEHPLSAVRLIDEIRPMGYEGSLVTLRRFLASLRDRQRAHAKVTLRFETPPGQQAQADWGFCGRLLNSSGQPCCVYVFTYVLCYSRMLFIRFTTSMKMAQLIACHQEAFAAFGGWPHEVLYDNMKQVRTGPGRLNEQFLDFAGHHGFTPKTCRPYRARTKGKVERMVDYVKDNFLLGRTFAGLDDLNGQGQAWLAQTANVRIHGTTGQRPVDLFEQERGLLVPLGSVPAYRFLDPVQRTVSWEAMVHYHGSRYSVPPAYAGQKVHVAAAGGQVIVQAGDTVIAEHRQAAQQGQSIVDKSHLEELWKITREQVKPAEEVRWRQAEPEVARAPLSAFEEVLP